MTIKGPRFYKLDADNHLVAVADLLEWGRWLEDANRHVGFTQITSQVFVSTVFMGLDHRYFDRGPPIVFETVVFGGPLDGQGDRYSSWDDAETGHKMFVKKTRKALGQKITEVKNEQAKTEDC
jgi:hypothetical protein